MLQGALAGAELARRQGVPEQEETSRLPEVLLELSPVPEEEERLVNWETGARAGQLTGPAGGRLAGTVPQQSLHRAELALLAIPPIHQEHKILSEELPLAAMLGRLTLYQR